MVSFTAQFLGTDCREKAALTIHMDVTEAAGEGGPQRVQRLSVTTGGGNEGRLRE